MSTDSNGGAEREVVGTPSVFLSDADCTLWHGDVLKTLRELARLVGCTPAVMNEALKAAEERR